MLINGGVTWKMYTFASENENRNKKLKYRRIIK